MNLCNFITFCSSQFGGCSVYWRKKNQPDVGLGMGKEFHNIRGHILHYLLWQPPMAIYKNLYKIHGQHFSFSMNSYNNHSFLFDLLCINLNVNQMKLLQTIHSLSLFVTLLIPIFIHPIKRTKFSHKDLEVNVNHKTFR